MSRSISVLLAQLEPRTHDPGANAQTVCHLLDEHPDADLAVFPELFLQSYALKGLIPLDLDTCDEVGAIRGSARRNRTAVVTGVAERTRGGMVNTALCVDDTGEIAARYRKVHLFGKEARWFSSGDEYVLATLCDLAVAPLVCYDLEFPEAPRAVAAAGAELLVTIAANMDPYAGDHALFVRCRALENHLPHVYVNCVGQENGLTFCGGSAVADASGRVLAELPPYRREVRLVTVPVGDHPSPDYLADRRPEVTVRARPYRTDH